MQLVPRNWTLNHAVRWKAALIWWLGGPMAGTAYGAAAAVAIGVCPTHWATPLATVYSAGMMAIVAATVLSPIWILFPLPPTGDVPIELAARWGVRVLWGLWLGVVMFFSIAFGYALLEAVL
jgi:hypothetical protein